MSSNAGRRHLIYWRDIGMLISLHSSFLHNPFLMLKMVSMICALKLASFKINPKKPFEIKRRNPGGAWEMLGGSDVTPEFGLVIRKQASTISPSLFDSWISSPNSLCLPAHPNRPNLSKEEDCKLQFELDLKPWLASEIWLAQIIVSLVQIEMQTLRGIQCCAVTSVPSA